MNKEHRAKVQKYFDNHTPKPLMFSTEFTNNADYGIVANSDSKTQLFELRRTAAKLPLRKLILEIIELAKFYGTRYCHNKRRQCDPDRRRTCTDIYKIIMNYRDDITIFDVMHELYKILQDKRYSVCTSYCDVVRRRTFRFEYHHIYDRDHRDEFGLMFADWKDI